MSNHPIPAPMPLPHDDTHGALDPTLDPTREVDGRDVLDPDLNDDLIDSAEADVIASGADGED